MQPDPQELYVLREMPQTLRLFYYKKGDVVYIIDCIIKWLNHMKILAHVVAEIKKQHMNFKFVYI